MVYLLKTITGSFILISKNHDEAFFVNQKDLFEHL